MNKYFLAMLVVVVVLALGSALRFYFVMWIGERVVADVRDAVFSHLLKLSPGFFETQRTGEVVSRLTADTTQIKAAFSSTASIALRNGVMLIGTIAMMVATSPRLAGLSLLALPLVVLPLVIYGRRVRNLSRNAQDTLASSAAFAQERLQAVSTVQANLQEDTVTQRLRGGHRTGLLRRRQAHLRARRADRPHHRRCRRRGGLAALVRRH